MHPSQSKYFSTVIKRTNELSELLRLETFAATAGNWHVWIGYVFTFLTYIRHLSYCFCIVVNCICVAISRVHGALKAWSEIHLGNSKQKLANLDLPIPVMYNKSAGWRKSLLWFNGPNGDAPACYGAWRAWEGTTEIMVIIHCIRA